MNIWGSHLPAASSFRPSTCRRLSSYSLGYLTRVDSVRLEHGRDFVRHRLRPARSQPRHLEWRAHLGAKRACQDVGFCTWESFVGGFGIMPKIAEHILTPSEFRMVGGHAHEQ